MGSQRGGSLRPYLELVRPPALFTAAADSITGYAWVSSCYLSTQSDTLPVDEVITCGLLVLISALIYAAGMCSNDIFDRAEDLQDRPQRPLPSQRVSLKSAWMLVISSQISALILAGTLSHLTTTKHATRSSDLLIIYAPLWVSIATVCATYLYNKVFKQWVVAPLMMGVCRFGNFWIGGALCLSYAGSNSLESDQVMGGLILSLGTLIYVTALTALSRFEVSGGRGARFAAFALCLTAVHPLIGWSMGVMSWGASVSLIVSLWLAVKLWPLLSGATLSGSAAARGVGAGIRGVALTNLALCLGLSAWWSAGLILVMVWGASRVARWFYAT